MMRNIIAALFVAILGFSSMAFAEGKSAKININTASAKTLDKELKYVGETIAKRIVEYRRKHGNFSSIEELSNVRGIGKKVVEANKKNVVVQ
ncbi:hypothetical protein GCM10023116_30410 [Kistimonas scapharcae]|uniref:Competence protein ComEA n=1 Tax=Kistimonas scapharcae TaxID=1036133 RepID=A0ABP8V3E9_9GAMM